MRRGPARRAAGSLAGRSALIGRDYADLEETYALLSEARLERQRVKGEFDEVSVGARVRTLTDQLARSRARCAIRRSRRHAAS